jgi:alpha-glucosidase
MMLAVLGCGTDAVVLEGTCGGELPAFASIDDGDLVARCGELEVAVRPLVDGIVRLRYGAPGRRSFAVVGDLAVDREARFGGEGGAATVCTATMSVTIDERCRVRATLADGTVIADDESFAIAEDAARLVRRPDSTRIYGLGERTGGLDKRGRAWTFWNTDAYDPALGGWKPDQDPLYQSIPFEVRVGEVAFGVFTDEPRRMTIDYSDPARDTITAYGARSLEQYLIAGPRMADVVERYTRLTGRPALPPRWALGFHQSRWGYPDGATVEAVAARFRTEGIPADAMWLDIQHHRGYRTFTFDEPAFSDAMLARLAELGFRTIAIADPGIKVDPGWDVYDGGVAGGHFLPFTGNAWPGVSAWPDFSRPETRAWWGEHVARLADRGIAGIWLDVNEPTTFPEGGGGTSIPDDVAVNGDGDPTTMAVLHNAYALLQAQATYEALAPRGQPFVLSRAGYAGIQRYAAVWTGDVPSTWDGLAQTLPMLVGLGVSGVPIVGSDIGGYSGHASAELYARWLALGSISPFARAHVTNGVPGQEPWMFDDEVLAIARARLADRYRLLPYFESLAAEASRTGAPLLRPLAWEFPGIAERDDHAMLGPFVLAAPVLAQGATTHEVALPPGRWYELHSGALYEGTITVGAPLAALPLFVREGAILPTTDGVDLYPGAASRFTLADGTVLDFDGSRLQLSQPRSLTIRVHGVASVSAVDGAESFHHDANARILVATLRDASDVRFTFERALADAPIAVTFEVRVPVDTPMTSPIHVAISATGWQHAPLAWIEPGLARGSVMLPRGEWFDYKFTRGDWDTVEKLANCSEARNRYTRSTATTQLDTVATWRDRCE